MDSTYKKHFEDRYAQSREQQILDYLNQRGAPVPRIILNHADQGYLEMDHAGQSLAHWLDTQGNGAAQAVDVLSTSLASLLEVSKLGIWHLDIAARNFLIQGGENGMPSRVLLIDFGNAVSELFPLQKPLWMLPETGQHPRVRQALQQDWQAFYQRHSLTPPPDWDEPFDVPLELYRKDWTSGLAVQKAGAGYCVLAHGWSRMLTGATGHWRHIPNQVSQALLALSNLDNEAQADACLQDMLHSLQAWAQASRATPRPLAAVQGPAESAKAAGADDSPPERWGTQPGPAAAAQAPRPVLKGLLQSSWFLALAGGALITLGWTLLDLIYAAARSPVSSAGLHITYLVLAGVGLSALVTAVCVLGLLLSRQRLAWLQVCICAHVLGQALAVLDLWLHRMPTIVLLMAGLFPAASLVSAFFLGRRRKQDLG